MKMQINYERTTLSVQEEFNSVFPYLRLDFLSKKNMWQNKTLGKFKTGKDIKGKLTIESYMTVEALEKCFNKIFGLQVQIFRKSGKAWLETTLTNQWTLEEQNRQGEELSK